MSDRQDSDREVLTSLPRSRPVRRSDKRAARPDPAAAAAPKAKARASSAGASTSRNGSAASTATAKPAAAAQPKAATKPRAAARATRARPATGAGRPAGRPPRKIPPAGYASPGSHAEDDRTSGSAELVGNAVQAAGELAQIGFAVGRQALQSMIDRLPKP
jgi:hypothetical protein